jgi:hypothetical protein
LRSICKSSRDSEHRAVSDADKNPETKNEQRLQADARYHVALWQHGDVERKEIACGVAA